MMYITYVLTSGNSALASMGPPVSTKPFPYGNNFAGVHCEKKETALVIQVEQHKQPQNDTVN